VGFASVLDGLSKQRRPVYVELDPATKAITQVLIPHVARVAGISAVEGSLDVERASRGLFGAWQAHLAPTAILSTITGKKDTKFL
jgi:hypothetical protein